MIQIKKTILTLVALFAMTTGAWAVSDISLKEITADMVKETWKDNNTIPVTTTDFPGFTATTLEAAKALGVPYNTGYVIVIYRVDDNGYFMALRYNNGEYDGEIGMMAFGSIYTNIGFGDKYYYTGIASAGPEVSGPTIVEGKPQWSFTMPGGNVELEPEYYDQATVADGGVTAADADARATTDDPLVKVDATKLTGAKKLMYFVSNSGTTAPAYDAEGWTDQLPNAEGFTQQGIVYVWYYPVGTDEGVDGATATYSDGDICLQSITARIAAAPTYAVTFADDLAEPTEWTASPAADVKKGQTVTVTYSGSKKVLGVKAEKKSAYEHSITIAVDPSTKDPIATAPAMTIEFNTGETWADVAARYDWLDTYLTYTVFYKDNILNGNVHDANGGVTPDKTIDPNGSYHWGL